MRKAFWDFLIYALLCQRVAAAVRSRAISTRKAPRDYWLSVYYTYY